MHIVVILVIGILVGAAGGSHFTALHWDEKLETWVSKFTEDQYNLNMSADINRIGIMYDQAKLIENGEIEEFYRKACLYMKIALDGVELSNYKESGKFVSIVKNTKEFVEVNKAKGRCENK